MLATRRRILLDRRRTLVDRLKQRDKLVGLWRASSYRNDGSQWLKDLSGRGHHLKLGSSVRAEILDGALLLGGTTGNYAFSVDSTVWDILGDIDIRAKVCFDTTRPSAAQTIVNRGGNSPNLGWFFRINTDGTLLWTWSPDGTTAATTHTSTVALANTPGLTIWVRIVFDVDNGAAGKTTKFYTSDDGVVWTQLGADVTGAGVTTLPNITAAFEIGSRDLGVTQLLAGKVYTVELRNSAGTLVASPDFRVQNDGTTSFTDAQGNVWHLPYAKVQAGALVLPSIASNTASTPDASTLDILGDIDIRAKLALDDWTPAAGIFAQKYGNAGNRSWYFSIGTNGRPFFVWSADGTATITATATAAPVIADGAELWVRVTLDVDNGATQNEAKFYTSSDGVTWTQLGATATTAGVTSIFNSTASLIIGDNAQFAGRVMYLEVRNGIAGTVVANPDFTARTDGTTSFVDSTSKVWTVNATNQGTDTNDPKFLKYDGQRYIYFPGININGLSVPDAAAVSITGDITLDADVALDDWTPSATQTLIAKSLTSGNQRSYRLQITTGGLIQLSLSTDGINIVSATSSIAVPVGDGGRIWVRACWRDSDNRVQFFTSPDGSTWTQLGTDQAIAIAGIFDSTAIVEIGALDSSSAQHLTGKVYRARVFSGDLGTGSAAAALDIDTNQATHEANTFTAVTGQTVTIVRHTAGRVTMVVTRDMFVYATDDLLEHPNHDDFNFAAADSFTVATVVNHIPVNATYESAMSKRAATAATAGWEIGVDLTAGDVDFAYLDTAATEFPTLTAALTAGVLTAIGGRRNTANDDGMAFAGSTLGASDADSTTGTLSNATRFLIGARRGSGDASYISFSEGEWHSAAVIREALTDVDIRQLQTELLA